MLLSGMARRITEIATGSSSSAGRAEAASGTVLPRGCAVQPSERQMSSSTTAACSAVIATPSAKHARAMCQNGAISRLALRSSHQFQCSAHSHGPGQS